MYPLKNCCRKTIFLLVLFFSGLLVRAQHVVINGYIKDALNDERIPFASIQFVKSGIGKLSDSAGNFMFRLNKWPSDTIQATYVGYQDYKLVLTQNQLTGSNNDTLRLVIQMERGKYTAEVVVKSKIDRGLLLWRKIVRRKAFNDKYYDYLYGIVSTGIVLF